VSRGFSVEYLTDLTIDDLDALVAQVDRVKAADEWLAAHTAIRAAQASGEDFQEYVETVIEPRLGFEKTHKTGARRS